MTAWTDFLAEQGATLDGNTLSFADAGAEARAATEATIAVPLVHLGLIRSVGPDSASFLHNLVSNDVLKLAADGAAWNSFNSPKGRMIASLLMWPEAEGHAMAVSADILAPFLKKLSMYVLRSKLRLADASADTLLIGVAGPEAARALQAAGVTPPPAVMKQSGGGDIPRCIRITDTAFVLAVQAQAAAQTYAALVAGGATKAGTAAWQLTMIRAGLPLVTAPTQEEFVAQMLNYELIGGVSFQKGCYPGQEIVARTQYLGKLKKRMYRVALPADAAAVPGADLYASGFGEQSAGKLVNVAPAPGGGYEALAVLQSSSAEAGDIHLGDMSGAKLKLLDLPYTLG